MIDFKFSKSSGILLMAAAIWGFAFVAQRAGMQYIGPFTFNSIRFILGTLFLWLLIYAIPFKFIEKSQFKRTKYLIPGGVLSGIILFAGASFQQVGMVCTSAGNAGFITSLYILLVPVLGLIFGHKVTTHTWIGILFALPGFFVLSLGEKFTLTPGDGIVLISAVFFAIHVMIIGWLTQKANPLKLSIIQFFVCGFLSGIVALASEKILLDQIVHASIPLVYGGIFSVGVAYTLQVIGQRKTKPAQASMILSMESLFAVVGGWLILDEGFTVKKLTGCGLILTGIIISLINKKLVFIKKAS